MLAAIFYAADQRDAIDAQHVVAEFLCIALTLQPGTGGLQTLEYYKARDGMGYPPVRSELDPQRLAEPAIRNPIEDLAHIRAFLRPAVADLANALGVSREALYDWQAGKPVAADNAARLADIGRAADVLAAQGLLASAQLIRRPIRSGLTLLDIVRDGGSAEQEAGVLAGLVRRELRQRDKLATRLFSRPRQTGGVEELGAPVLDEVVEAAL